MVVTNALLEEFPRLDCAMARSCEAIMSAMLDAGAEALLAGAEELERAGVVAKKS